MENKEYEMFVKMAAGNIWDQLDYLNNLPEEETGMPPPGVKEILNDFITCFGKLLKSLKTARMPV